MDDQSVEWVRSLVEGQQMTVSDLATHLQSLHPGERGFSVANVRRFCRDHSISRVQPPQTADELNRSVARAVQDVGGSYGRRMMTAHLRARGVNVAECRVGRALAQVHPYYHANRQQGAQRQLNPSSYHAPYFGYNLHLDQNEKLIEWGVTLVLSVDGCSTFIPAFSVMAVKNNITIYREVFANAVSTYGLWEEVIVDHGKEFYLTLFMQQYLRGHCQDASCSRPPYRQVTSTVVCFRPVSTANQMYRLENNRVERMWVEVNQRILYPIKYCLLDMEGRSNVSRAIPEHLFAISTVVQALVEHGLKNWAETWNLHAIPGRGVPQTHVDSRQNLLFDVRELLAEDDARQMYEQQGGRLSDEAAVGADRLAHVADRRQARHNLFSARCNAEIGSVADIFSATVSHNYALLQNAIELFVSVSDEISANM